MTYTHLGRLGRCSLVGLFLWLACKGEDRSRPLEDQNPGGFAGTRPVSNLGGSGGGGGEAGAGGSATQADAGPDSGFALNCENVICSGAGRCVVGSDNLARCVCDPGYVLGPGNECVVDEECINLRLLEESCRQLTDAQPSLALFFGVETCAGTTVRPEILGPLNSAFRVLEDGEPLNEESYVALFAREVESYVSIAVDLSQSLQQDQQVLVAVIGRLKKMVQDLTPAPGGPPVRVQLIVFGRTIHVAQPFTEDLSAVTAQLDVIQANPAAAVAEPGGTNLYGAVNLGLASLEGAIEARIAETRGAVVATGTQVTVTDGGDTSGIVLEKLPPRFNFISVGISTDISDVELTTIGPQGSFLAPEQSDWESAFDRVVARVLEYPRRSYLLGYCSPAVAGNHTVAVSLANRAANANATCAFRGEEFGGGAGLACNEAFISGYCASDSCGDFLACGARPGVDAGTGTCAAEPSWEFSR